jgi:hypothetical protein
VLKVPLCYCVLKTDVFAHNLRIKELGVLIFSIYLFLFPRGCSWGALEILINGRDVIACISLSHSLSHSHLCLSIVQNSKSDGPSSIEFPMPVASLISPRSDHLFMWRSVSIFVVFIFCRWVHIWSGWLWDFNSMFAF